MVRLLLLFFIGAATHELSSAQDLKLKLEHLRTFNGHSFGVRKVIFSPNGSNFASGGTRGELFIWNVDGDGTLKQLEGHLGSICDVRYSKDGKYLVSAGEDGQVKVWDPATGALVRQMYSPSGVNNPVNKVNFATISSETGTVYFGGTNRLLCKAQFKDGRPEVIYTDPKDEIQCATLSPNGQELIFAVGKYLMALDLRSGKIVREYNTGDCLVNSLKFSADGTRLLSWCSNSRVDIRDPSNFYLDTSFRSGAGGTKFSNLAFTEDEKYVITGDHASRFNVWDLANKRLVLDQGAEQGTIMTFDVKSGLNYLLSGSLDKSIKLWRIVEDVPEEPKNKKKVVVEPAQVTPDVQIIKYEKPVQDVPQTSEVKSPTITNVVLGEPKKTVEVVKVTEVVTEKAVAKESEKVEEIAEKTVVGTTVWTGEPIVSPLPELKNSRRVKPIRKEHRLVLNSHQLTFELWDAQVIDGDIVSIYIDDKCIVNEYSITATKKVVTFDASNHKRVYLYLHAHNLGTISPNTVTMTVSDGNQILEIELRSDLTGSSAVEITFED
jgi:WD40 repeat protein